MNYPIDKSTVLIKIIYLVLLQYDEDIIEYTDS
jgi:hypothetical protein